MPGTTSNITRSPVHFDSGWTVNSDGLSSSFDDDDDDDDDAEYEASIPEVAAMTVPVSLSFAIRGELGGGFGGVNILCCVLYCPFNSGRKSLNRINISGPEAQRINTFPLIL